MLERGDILLHDTPAGGGGPSRALAAAIAEHLSRVGREKGVAGPSLAALEGLEQESVGTAVELRKGGHGRVAVEHDLPCHRNHPRPRRARWAKRSEAAVIARPPRGTGRRGHRCAEIVRGRPGGGEQGELPVRLHLPDRQRPLELDVAAVDGPRFGRRQEIAAVLEHEERGSRSGALVRMSTP